MVVRIKLRKPAGMSRSRVFLATSGVLIVSLGGYGLYPHCLRNQVSRNTVVMPVQVVSELPTAAKRQRLIYPNSIVSGGVFSKTEVQTAVSSDPVVAAHYSEIKLADLKLAKFVRDAKAYVSYRRGDRVYWSSKPVQLHGEEQVLTDGRNHIRARCGNRISETQRGPTASRDEPMESVLDSPLDPVLEANAAPDPLGPNFTLPNLGLDVPVFTEGILSTGKGSPIGPRGILGVPVGGVAYPGTTTPPGPGTTTPPPGGLIITPTGPELPGSGGGPEKPEISGVVLVPGEPGIIVKLPEVPVLIPDGHTPSEEPSGPQVPEPGTFISVFLALAAVMFHRKQFSSNCDESKLLTNSAKRVISSHGVPEHDIQPIRVQE
jgi:hypothetical protein